MNPTVHAASILAGTVWTSAEASRVADAGRGRRGCHGHSGLNVVVQIGLATAPTAVMHMHYISIHRHIGFIIGRLAHCVVPGLTVTGGRVGGCLVSGHLGSRGTVGSRHGG
jgi:hypothetical protein